MSVLNDFSALHTAITGKPASNDVVQIIQAACELAGSGDEEFPQYLRTVAQDLVARRTHPPTEIPEQERGFSWLFRELSPALPGSELRNESKDDVFVLPSLQLAVVITRGTVETYSVVPWSEKTPSSPNELVVLNAFDPTFDQVREWAYSPNMRLTAQDEEAIVSHINYIPLLIELAADPQCPKRTYLLAIVDGYVVGIQRNGYDRQLLKQCQLQAAQTTAPDLQTWAQDLAYLAEYLDGQDSVTLETAREITRIVLTGRYRPSLVVKELALTDWWQFTTSFPDNGYEIDKLYICQISGALVWSRDTLTHADLVPYTNPIKRDDPLRQ
jgi:hypothetical protein